MNIRMEFSAEDIRRLIAKAIVEKTGNVVSANDINIQVKSKQNYKAEWEVAEFKGVYHVVE